MRKRTYSTLILLVLLLPLVLIACRRDEEDETPTATLAATAPVEDEPAEEATSTPPAATDEPEPTEEPVAISTIDPADIDWAPQVIYTSPERGQEALLDGAITIRFDQAMEQESVEEAFEISGDAAREVSGQFEWPRPDTLVFTPRSNLQRSASYQVRIGETARSQNGQTLEGTFEQQFQTVGDLQVSQVIPGEGVNGVATDGSITVLFNRPVVPLVSTAQQAGLPQPLQIEPDVAGEGEWISTSIYRFTPDEGFAGATEYEVTVAEGLEDVSGSALREPFSWTFTTAQPSVAQILPDVGDGDIIPTEPLTVTFNMPMDQASTESAIALDPAAPLQYEWSEDGTTVTLRPEGQLEMETRYTLTIGDSAQAATGQASLDRATSTIFTTVPLPAVVSTQPQAGVTTEPWQYGINIEFASPMDRETVEGRVQINPAPEREPEYFWGNSSRFLSVAFVLQRNVEYQITVPADAADPYGNTLGEAYTWSFTTPPLTPLVSLNLPQHLAQLSDDFPSVVDIVHRNVSDINAALYQLDPFQRIQLLLEPSRVNEFTAPGSPLRNWSLSTNTQLDEADSTVVDLSGNSGTLPTGVYFLEASAPELRDDYRWWQNQRALIVVAGTNLVIKETFGEVHVWATDLATGQPASGLELTLFDYNSREVGTATTGADGLATFAYDQPEEYIRGVMVVSGQPGDAGFGIAASTWQQGVSPFSFDVPATTNDEQPEFAYLYTDRPIYRPGDTVQYRGILRDSNYARYDLTSREEVQVQAQFISFFEPESDAIDYEVTLPVDENGTFSGEFPIPEDAPLGEYRLFITDEQAIANAARTFTVAQYRRPEFTVSVTPQQEELLRGETVDVVVEAAYFFGGPASDLAVEWTVRQQPYNFPWEGPYYSFDDQDDFVFRYGDEMGFFGEFVTQGAGRTDGEGRLVISLPADLLEEAQDGSRLVTVEATIRDISEFPVTATGQVVFHASETYVGIAPQDYINVAGAETGVDLITVDWEGNPVANQDVEVVFYERTYEWLEPELPGASAGRWEPNDTEVTSTTVTTDGNGEAEATFEPETGGTYRARATVSDDAGREHNSSTLFWVSSSDFVGWRVNPEEKRMDLTPDQRTYEVGDTANVLVQSPFEGPVQAWLIIERGTVIEQRIITLQSNSEQLEIPVTESLSPNAFVSVVAIKGMGTPAQGAPLQYADIRMGLTELVVPPDPFALNVSLTPQDDMLSPGETVTYDIQVTDTTGAGVQADLSLALVDLAVLTLKEDNAPPILDAFYSRQPYRSYVGSGLFVCGEGLPLDIPEEQLGLGGGGGGGDVAEEAGRVLQEEDGVRRDFPDTAFWRASLSTDENGQATIDIPLPDTLTTWRLSSKAVTADSQVGQNSVDIVSTLPLLIRPVTPRFFTVNDVVQIGAIINNNTSQSLDVTASLEAEGLTLSSDTEQELTIGANSQQLVRWEVTANDVTHADLTFRAEGGEYSDATKPSFGEGPDQLIPVRRYDAEDIVGTSGVLAEPGRQVEAVLLPPQVDTREGSVDVQMSPSLAAALIDALDYVEPFDPTFTTACAHSTVDAFLPNLVTARALAQLGVDEPELANRLDDLVNNGIQRLASLQKGDGGWGWCFSEESSPYLTAYVLFGLAKAEEAGYDVSAVDIERAIPVLDLDDAQSIRSSWAANRQAWYLYVLAELDVAQQENVDALFDEQREVLDPYAKAYLALAYELLGQHESNNQQALLADLNSEAIVSATGTHWEDEERDWMNLNSTVRGTAVVIDALARIEPESPLAAPAVRWLMSARTATHWSTGFETAWSILALSDWMVSSGELEADYDYVLNANGRELEAGHFDESNLTESVETSIPMRNLLTDDANYLIFEHGEGPGRLYYTAHLDAYVNAESVEAISRGVTVERVYYDAECDPETETCEPIDQIEAGQRVRVQLTLVAPNDLTYLRLEDPIPAGAEAIDPGLATSAAGLGGQIEEADAQDQYRWGYWGWWYFERIEYRDDRVVFLSEALPAGTYQYTYYLETPIPGQFQVRPAIAYEEFFPEVFGRSNGALFEITE
jgi:uncharacterized protein YfaS (alpha-2-macroglobulin family)